MPMEDVSFSFSEDYGTLMRLCREFDMITGDDGPLAPDCRILVLTIRRGEETVGFASGMFSAASDTFRIFGVRVPGEEHRRELATGSLRALLEEARERFGAKYYEWIYDLQVGKKDIFEGFLRSLRIPWLKRVRREVLGRRVRIRTSGLAKSAMPHNRSSFSRESVARNGFVVVPLDEITPETAEKVNELLAAPEEENVGLSPFVGENNYDKRTSFVVLEKTTGAVAGWIVCRRQGRDTEFRRWYCSKRFRKENLGVIMIGLLLRTVQEAGDAQGGASAGAGAGDAAPSSEGLLLFMLADSPSSAMLQKFYKSYFKGSIDWETDVCRLTLEESGTAHPQRTAPLQGGVGDG